MEGAAFRLESPWLLLMKLRIQHISTPVLIAFFRCPADISTLFVKPSENGGRNPLTFYLGQTMVSPDTVRGICHGALSPDHASLAHFQQAAPWNVTGPAPCDSRGLLPQGTAAGEATQLLSPSSRLPFPFRGPPVHRAEHLAARPGLSQTVAFSSGTDAARRGGSPTFREQRRGMKG